MRLDWHGRSQTSIGEALGLFRSESSHLTNNSTLNLYPYRRVRGMIGQESEILDHGANRLTCQIQFHSDRPLAAGGNDDGKAVGCHASA
jgi:hypothetical protein